MSVTIEIVENPAKACAALMVGTASAGGHIVLSGGSTPKAAHEHFVAAARAVSLDLSQTTFWMGDERCVAPDDERSNYRMISETLLEPLAGPGAPTMHRMRGELGPDAGADDYARVIEEAGVPAFDLLLLGIGPDGHFASLFPQQPSLRVDDRPVVGVPMSGLEPFVARISLTLAAVAAARRVVVLAAGEGKAEAIAEAFGPEATADAAVPASLLAEAGATVTVVIDPAAASGLPGE